MTAVSDMVTDPESVVTGLLTYDERAGVVLRVVSDRLGQIVTAYPRAATKTSRVASFLIEALPHCSRHSPFLLGHD